ncbi:MAG: hypothetical protein GY851_15215 [bacterium]|nr:hypothetical protein [bacterium]
MDGVPIAGGVGSVASLAYVGGARNLSVPQLQQTAVEATGSAALRLIQAVVAVDPAVGQQLDVAA